MSINMSIVFLVLGLLAFQGDCLPLSDQETDVFFTNKTDVALRAVESAVDYGNSQLNSNETHKPVRKLKQYFQRLGAILSKLLVPTISEMIDLLKEQVKEYSEFYRSAKRLQNKTRRSLALLNDSSQDLETVAEKYQPKSEHQLGNDVVEIPKDPRQEASPKMDNGSRNGTIQLKFYPLNKTTTVDVETGKRFYNLPLPLWTMIPFAFLAIGVVRGLTFMAVIIGFFIYIMGFLIWVECRKKFKHAPKQKFQKLPSKSRRFVEFAADDISSSKLVTVVTSDLFEIPKDHEFISSPTNVFTNENRRMNEIKLMDNCLCENFAVERRAEIKMAAKMK